MLPSPIAPRNTPSSSLLPSSSSQEPTAPPPSSSSSSQQQSLLSPPVRPVVRSRASSTGVRPPLSLQSCSPRVCSIASFPDLSTSSPSEDPQADPSTSSVSSLQSSGGRTRISTMVPVVVEKSFELLRALRPGVVVTKHAKGSNGLFDDTPISSPRSSMDSEFILPLSASSAKLSFDTIECTPPPPHHHLRLVFRMPSVHAPLLLVIILFPVSTALILFCLSTLPISASWPRTLSDLAALGGSLNAYAQSGPAATLHILAVLSVSAIWKHAWSIPGSVLWNVLAGALFHPILATLVMTTLTTLGSVSATLLSMPLAPFLTRFFPRPIELTRAALEGSPSSSASISIIPLTSSSSRTSSDVEEDEEEQVATFVRPTNLTASSSSTPSSSPTSSRRSSNATLASLAPSITPTVVGLPVSSQKETGTPAWVRLSVLRLIGIVPWSALNIACGVTGVALRDCAAGAFIGTLPWTAVTCQIGDILHTVGVVSGAGAAASAGDVVEGAMGAAGMGNQTLSSVLASPTIIAELVFLSVLSLAPVLGREWLKKFISSSSSPSSPAKEVTREVEVEVEVLDGEKDMRHTRRVSDEESYGGMEMTCGEDEEQQQEVDQEKEWGRGRERCKVHQAVRRQRWKWNRISLSVPRWSLLRPDASTTTVEAEKDVRRLS